MEHTEPTHQEGCLLCAVRALTEGEPEYIEFKEPGDEVKGVVIRTGRRLSAMALDGDGYPYVWLWLGGHERVGVVGYGTTMRAGLMDADAKVGDTLTIRFEERTEIKTGRFAGKPYSRYSVAVQRGH